MQRYMRLEIARVDRACQCLRTTMKLVAIFDCWYGPAFSANAYEADE